MHWSPLVFALHLFIPFVSAYTWPSQQYDALEGLLYEGRRPDGSSLSGLVHPCRKRTNTLASIAAEWLRFAFHDMATHNVDDGTGGMDGSIVYELGRPENFGLGFNQTLNDFEAFPNKLVSRADVISIAAIMAVATCDGPVIPFRAGRVDVWAGGATGAPEPQDDLPTLTESFRKQGFNQAEMIKLVACGHTMGGVRSSDFPQLVPPDPNSVNPVFDDFDTTMAFDNAVVTQYLDGSTKNILVVGTNQTMNSDLRVFQSDGNSTMKSLGDATVFKTECQSILGRMLDVVPQNVTLTDEITLLPAKVNNAQLTFQKNQLVFKSTFRLTQPTNTTANAKRNVTMLWCNKYGDNKNCAGKTNIASSVSKTSQNSDDVSPITKNLGYYFLFYDFVVPINSNVSISKFWFKVDEMDGSTPTTYNNGGSGYPIDQDQVLFIPKLSHVDLVPVNSTSAQTYTNRYGQAYTHIYSLVAAVRDGVNPSRVYADASDVAVAGFPVAISSVIEFKQNSTSFPSQAGYSFYTGTMDDIGVQLTMDLHAVTDQQTYTQTFVQTLVLDGTSDVTPATVGTIASTKSAASSLIGRSWEVWHALLVLLLGVIYHGEPLLGWVL